MPKNKTINVKGTEIVLFSVGNEDYVSITDIARHKDSANTDSIIQNWLRNRNTIELLGFWELMYNPGFKPLEFEGFKKQAGLNSFVMTPKKWMENTNAGERLFRPKTHQKPRAFIKKTAEICAILTENLSTFFSSAYLNCNCRFMHFTRFNDMIWQIYR